MANDLTLLERFERKISPEPNSGCWLWMGNYFRKGYGALKANGKNVSAHRASWRLYRGDIPASKCVLHRCDNRACVNPDHLFLGTNDDNVADKVSKNRQHRAQGSSHGLAKLSEENIPMIFGLSRSGHVQREIAERFGVSRTKIGQILTGRAWTHVDGQ
jgi:hypothetical protein